MREGAQGPYVVLLAGLLEPDQESVLAALEAAVPTSEPIEADTLRQAMNALRASQVGCVLVGQRLVGAGGWAAVADELRRGAPAAALIALPQNEVVGHGWDDVVRPGDRDPRLMARVLRSAQAIARANERLTRWALRDPLTDVLNRRGLERVLIRETTARERGQGPLSALLVDCDDFKQVNDLFGLAAGDHALAAVAEAIGAAVRAGDTVARVGGDEFLVLLPQTRTWEAVEVAERVREQVRVHALLPDGKHMSVSIGVRRLDVGTDSITEIVAATQQGLMLSKAGGKDQVRVVDDSKGNSLDPDISLPEGTRIHTYQKTPVRRLDGLAHVRTLIQMVLEGETRMRLDAQRAALSAWDLWCFRAAAQEDPHPDVPVHLRIFPATVMEVPAPRVLATLPEGLELSRVVFTIDEQFLSGAPSLLKERLAPIRAAGVELCVDASDLGRTCLESLVLLRPETVQVHADLVRGVSGSRPRRGSLERFVRVCESLAVEVIAMGLDRPADRDAVAELGIRFGVGASLQP